MKLAINTRTHAKELTDQSIYSYRYDTNYSVSSSISCFSLFLDSVVAATAADELLVSPSTILLRVIGGYQQLCLSLNILTRRKQVFYT